MGGDQRLLPAQFRRCNIMMQYRRCARNTSPATLGRRLAGRRYSSQAHQWRCRSRVRRTRLSALVSAAAPAPGRVVAEHWPLPAVRSAGAGGRRRAGVSRAELTRRIILRPRRSTLHGVKAPYRRPSCLISQPIRTWTADADAHLGLAALPLGNHVRHDHDSYGGGHRAALRGEQRSIGDAAGRVVHLSINGVRDIDFLGREG